MLFVFNTLDNLLLEPEHSLESFFIMLTVEPSGYDLNLHYTSLDGKEHFLNTIKKLDYAKDITLVNNDELINILYGEL